MYVLLCAYGSWITQRICRTTGLGGGDGHVPPLRMCRNGRPK